jgi:hypothetical protein
MLGGYSRCKVDKALGVILDPPVWQIGQIFIPEEVNKLFAVRQEVDTRKIEREPNCRSKG